MLGTRTIRRTALAVVVLASFCAAYAAPLGMALWAAGSTKQCCPGGKAAHCCKRTHGTGWVGTNRSEEHTSELQSQSNLVCRLLLEKKKKNRNLEKDRTRLKS